MCVCGAENEPRNMLGLLFVLEGVPYTWQGREIGIVNEIKVSSTNDQTRHFFIVHHADTIQE